MEPPACPLGCRKAIGCFFKRVILRFVLLSLPLTSVPLSSLSLAILGLLSMHPMSGYDLRRTFTTTAMGRFSASPGAIYPALARLESLKWAKPESTKPSSLRPRKAYTLTAAGRKALMKHLAEPVSREDIIWRLDHLHLRFSFMGLLPVKESRHFLLQLSEGLEAYAHELQLQLDAFPDLSVPQPRLALVHGIESTLATARWARGAIPLLPPT